jgi:hypothetical protein
MSNTQSGFPRTVGTAVVPGGAPGNFAVPGIRAGDTLLSVVSVTAALARTDRFANASIPAGTSETVEIATANTAGSWLIITWAKAQ